MNKKAIVEGLKLLYKKRTDDEIKHLAREGYSPREVIEMVGMNDASDSEKSVIRSKVYTERHKHKKTQA